MVLEVLVGMIASGKSTYARRRADEGALVVAHDDLTAMLHARYRYEPGLREFYRRMEEALVVECLYANRDVVIDRTHLTRESRARWTKPGAVARPRDSVGRPAPLDVVAVVFPIEPAAAHALRRFNSDPRGRSYEDWYEVASHHAAQAEAEPIDASEGFARIVRHAAGGHDR